MNSMGCPGNLDPHAEASAVPAPPERARIVCSLTALAFAARSAG